MEIIITGISYLILFAITHIVVFFVIHYLYPPKTEANYIMPPQQQYEPPASSPEQKIPETTQIPTHEAVVDEGNSVILPSISSTSVPRKTGMDLDDLRRE
jgi:hypothetical protein